MAKNRRGSRRLLWILAVLLAGGLFGLNLNSLHDRLLMERVSGLQPQVEAAYSQVSNYHTLAINGAMAQAEAQAAALDALRQLRHGDDEYFWVMDQQGKLLMHPNLPMYEGQLLSDLPQVGGDHLYTLVSSVLAESGGGYFTYRWTRGGGDQLQDKSGYIRRFEPWGWAIGSGVYIDDVDDLFWREARSLFTVLFVLLAVLVIFWFGFEKTLFYDESIHGGLEADDDR